MYRRRARWSWVVAVAAAATLVGTQLPTASAAPVATPAGLSVYRVSAPTADGAQRLLKAGFDVLEKRSGDNLFVLGDPATAAKLRAAGFDPVVDNALAPLAGQAQAAPEAETMAAPGTAAVADPVDETYFGGYHTVRAQNAHLDKVAATYPNLTRVVDYGDSYLKTRNAAAGHDLKAICITHKTASYDCKLYPGAPRPRFVLMTQLHAREIVSGDIAWRFIDHLTQQYGKDSAVTSLLNGTEVWVIPVANPDGVELVQQGGNKPHLQRKNLNGTGCANPPTSGSQRGVDLNRNTSTHWGTTGVDFDKCSQTYPGTAGDSEPETKALQWLFRTIWPDQRGPNDNDAAPVTAKGAMVSIHAYAGIILFPWGWDDRKAPNDAALRGIAAKMADLTGYDYGQPGEVLYNASGNIEDWTYAQLGVASFTIEAASCNSFTPPHSCAASDFTKILPALMHVAQKAKAPYKP